jgi:hypothetical protein
MWNLIWKGNREKYVMCTSTFNAYNSDVSNEEMDCSGLVDGHAYSLLNAKKVDTQKG